MASKSEIYESAAVIKSRVAELCGVIAADQEFRRRGGTMFPHYTIGANLDPIFELLGKSGNEWLLSANGVTYVADIGCGNGELSFTLSRCGYKVTAIDYSYSPSQAPYVVLHIAKELDLPVAVVDFSVDRPFVMDDLKDHCIFDEGEILPKHLRKFDFVICLGLLYHLKNPFAFFESLARSTRRPRRRPHERGRRSASNSFVGSSRDCRWWRRSCSEVLAG